MKLLAFLLALLLLPALARADGLATSICVLDTPTYSKLLKDYGETAKIPTDILWKAAIHHGYLLKDSCDLTFKQNDQSYHLLAAPHGTEGQVIYSITREAPGQPAHLLCVGTVGLDEVKKDRSDDPLIIILRAGNFLKQ